jgi:hypothetical protein
MLCRCLQAVMLQTWPRSPPQWQQVFWFRMASPGDQLKAEILRLQTQRDNIVFALNAVDVSNHLRAQLYAQLSSVDEKLVLLTGGISPN